MTTTISCKASTTTGVDVITHEGVELVARLRKGRAREIERVIRKYSWAPCPDEKSTESRETDDHHGPDEHLNLTVENDHLECKNITIRPDDLSPAAIEMRVAILASTFTVEQLENPKFLDSSLFGLVFFDKNYAKLLMTILDSCGTVLYNVGAPRFFNRSRLFQAGWTG